MLHPQPRCFHRIAKPLLIPESARRGLSVSIYLNPLALYGDKMRILRSSALFLAAWPLLATLSAAQTNTWTIDPNHSTAQFTVRHLAISNVSGNFTKVTGTVVLNDKD